MESTLTARISNVHSTVVRIQQQFDYEAGTISRLQSKIKQLEDEKTQLVKAVGLIDRCIQIISANGIGKIESIVSAGLQTVFGNDLWLVVEKKETARGNSYRLLVRDGETVGNPMDSFGGGVVNVISFLLRVILIKRFKLAKLLILDEQFNNVSEDYLPHVSEMLHKFTHENGFTILAVTHQPILASAADAIYQVSVEKGQPPTLLKESDLGLLGEQRPITEASSA
jgi:DNA repair exonuclease SbcCD ATPase subunit